MGIFEEELELHIFIPKNILNIGPGICTTYATIRRHILSHSCYGWQFEFRMDKDNVLLGICAKTSLFTITMNRLFKKQTGYQLSCLQQRWTTNQCDGSMQVQFLGQLITLYDFQCHQFVRAVHSRFGKNVDLKWHQGCSTTYELHLPRIFYNYIPIANQIWVSRNDVITRLLRYHKCYCVATNILQFLKDFYFLMPQVQNKQIFLLV